MARSSEVVKKILQFKLQLSDTTKPATVLKVLQKLKDLDVTLDILAETGIGKTVNSLRRHKQAGDLAKSLVKGWKELVPKQSTRCLPETVFVKSTEDDKSCPETASLSNDEQNDGLASNSKNPDTSDDDSFNLQSKQNDLNKGQNEKKGRKSEDNKNIEKSQQETLVQDVMSKTDIQVDKSEKKKKQSENTNGSPQKSRSDTREKFKSTNGSGRSATEQKSKPKSSNESLMESKDSCSSSEKLFKKLEEAKDDRSSEMSTSSEGQRRKRKKAEREKHDRVKRKPDSENKERSKSKKAKMYHKDEDSQSDREERKASLSFESFLNYDVKLFKRKDQSGSRKTPKIIKTVSKEQRKHPEKKPPKPPAPVPEEKPQESLMHLMDVPLPAALPELEKPSSIDYYFEKKDEREADFCDEESVVFTGQRLNSKMQVYSGAKTRFLPAMMSLYQQCIRTLQNNINLLYETGGVPFELLEPVLERCTPEQLLRIEEYNPIYMGLTDHLWGKHCQRDFKDCKLQEYESWKEMYIRVSEERERKLQRLTKSIVSAHSKKPKGRQVKMAFIHTVAKPPRDVRIQQEIHGTAVQQPHQLKCSVKSQENQIRPSCNERHDPSRSSSTSSGGSNTQDPRKKTRVAPMMAKSLKAFKKQLGRR